MYLKLKYLFVLLCIVIACKIGNSSSDSVENSRCIATDNYIRDRFNRENWMSNLGSIIADIPIKNLRMMGSHDTGTYTIVMAFDTYSVTQNSRVYWQLMGGIRYLDLRVGDYNGVPGIRVAHGSHYGSHIQTVLEGIAAYTRNHPKELVIMRVSESGSEIKAHQKVTLMNEFEKFFGSQMVKKSDTWFNVKTSTLGDFWRNKKSILVFFEAPIIQLSKYKSDGMRDLTWDQANTKGFWDANAGIYDPWPDTDSMTDLRIRNERYWSEAQKKDNLYVAQYILTASIKGGVYIRTKQMQHDNDLPNFFREYSPKGRFNIILADFVFGCNPGSEAYLIDEVIRSNIPNPKIVSIKPGFSNRVLTVKDDKHTNGTPLILYDDRKTNNQKFILYSKDGKELKAYAMNSLKLLQIRKDLIGQNGAQVEISDNTEEENQVWIVEEAQGKKLIINKMSGRAIDLDYGKDENFCKIQQWDKHGGGNQQWIFG